MAAKKITRAQWALIGRRVQVYDTKFTADGALLWGYVKSKTAAVLLAIGSSRAKGGML